MAEQAMEKIRPEDVPADAIRECQEFAAKHGMQELIWSINTGPRRHETAFLAAVLEAVRCRRTSASPKRRGSSSRSTGAGLPPAS